MADRSRNRFRGAGAIRGLLALLILAAGAVSLLPLVETDTWWVRYFDFVRIQLAIGLAVLLLLYLAFGAWRSATGLAVVVAGLAGLGYHVWRIHPYLPVVEAMVVPAADCPAENRLDVMVANVEKNNRHAAEFFRVVAGAQPDLLVVLETDEWWDRELATLESMLPHRFQAIPEDARFFGMHILSALPLESPEARYYFGADTPTLVTGVAMPGGGVVQLIGVHPRPPRYWDQPTTSRDGHMLAVALEAVESEPPSIVAGDFNAVPWERITRRAMRIGELLDPRVGRGFYTTYKARNILMSWPLDQVVFEDAFSLRSLEVLPAFESDHYPFVARICHDPSAAVRQSAQPLEAGDLEEAQDTLRAARALETGD